MSKSDKLIKAQVLVVLQYLLDYSNSKAHRTLQSLISNIPLEEEFIRTTITTFCQNEFIEKDYYSNDDDTYRLTDKGKHILRLKKSGMMGLLSLFIRRRKIN
jgi:predicted transcriptional regulator